MFECILSLEMQLRLKITQNVETCAHTSLTYRNLLHDDEPSSLGASMFTPTELNPRHVVSRAWGPACLIVWFQMLTCTAARRG